MAEDMVPVCPIDGDPKKDRTEIPRWAYDPEQWVRLDLPKKSKKSAKSSGGRGGAASSTSRAASSRRRSQGQDDEEED